MLTKLLRESRLLWRTWRWAVAERVGRIGTYFYQRSCPHIFRAALVSNKPARVCKLCDLSQELSREDFYAQFGERYQAILYTGPLAGAGLGNSKPTQESSLLH